MPVLRSSRTKSGADSLTDTAEGGQNYLIAHLDEIPATRCPCGFARRAFADVPNSLASIHMVDIESDSRTHYHKNMTEIYLVLEGEGEMELDGKRFPVRPMTAVYIHPGCRHRAMGKLKIINIPIPAFDEKDEWFD
jgi:mannose-6-phosphate isomerase-like protein (cupin superfamily)